MRKKVLCFLAGAIIFGILPVLPGAMVYAAENETWMVLGRVVSIDSEAGGLVVDCVSGVSGTPMRVEFSVPKNAVLMSGERAIGIEDLRVSDRVEIEFIGSSTDDPAVKCLEDLDIIN